MVGLEPTKYMHNCKYATEQLFSGIHNVCHNTLHYIERYMYTYMYKYALLGSNVD